MKRKAASRHEQPELREQATVKDKREKVNAEKRFSEDIGGSRITLKRVF